MQVVYGEVLDYLRESRKLKWWMTSRLSASRSIWDCVAVESGETDSGRLGRHSGKQSLPLPGTEKRESTARQNINLTISRRRSGSGNTWDQTWSRETDVQSITSHSAKAEEIIESAFLYTSASISARPVNWQKACNGAVRKNVNWLPLGVASLEDSHNGLWGERSKAAGSPLSAPWMDCLECLAIITINNHEKWVSCEWN